MRCLLLLVYLAFAALCTDCCLSFTVCYVFFFSAGCVLFAVVWCMSLVLVVCCLSCMMCCLLYGVCWLLRDSCSLLVVVSLLDGVCHLFFVVGASLCVAGCSLCVVLGCVLVLDCGWCVVRCLVFWCVLIVVCCVMTNADNCWLLASVCCVLIGVLAMCWSCLLPVVCRLLCVLWCLLLSVVRCRLLVVYWLMLCSVCGLLFVACGLSSVVLFAA